MQNFIKPALRCSALVLVLFLLTPASHAKKRNLGEIIDDSVIGLKLKSKFMRDKIVKASQINVDVRSGLVTLNGVVDNQEQINRAIEIAEQQKNVKEVKAYLVTRQIVSGEPQAETKKAKNIFSVFKKDGNTLPNDDKNRVIETDISNKDNPAAHQEASANPGEDFQEFEKQN